MSAPTLSPAGLEQLHRARPSASRWLQAALVALVCLLTGPRRVRGTVPAGQVLLVASHRSHADTAAILAALPPEVRSRTHPAAAEDHFFRSRLRGWWTTKLVGAFPFPRHGHEGLERAAAVLDAGGNVLLFPQGSRAGGAFRTGAARLALRGLTVVPVGLAGTGAVLPRGRWLPRRGPVAVAFGAPLRPAPDAPAAGGAARISGVATAAAELTEELRRRVEALDAAAAELLPPPRPSVLERVRQLAQGRAGVVLAFAWGLLEALVVPVVPDVAVALLVVAAPGRALPIALAATAGSLGGGLLAYFVGATLRPPPMLLVSERMVTAVQGWLHAEGPAALWRQPLGGIPFKVFAYLSGSSGVPLKAFLATSAVARGARILAAALVSAGIGRLLARVSRHRQALVYAIAAATGLAAFGLGLDAVVRAWR